MRTPEAKTSVELLVQSLRDLLPRAREAADPLHSAMRYAVFSGGSLIRPRLLLAVHAACGASTGSLPLALRTACALEYIHASAQVHDDLPCFGDLSTHQGRPATHAAFGEAMALLAGGALLSHAFTIVADVAPGLELRALRIVRLLGMAAGLVAGSAVDSTPWVDNGTGSGMGGGRFRDSLPAPPYARGAATPLTRALAPIDTAERQRSARTAALFQIAAEAGAVAAGSQESLAWGGIGEQIGLAYHLAGELPQRARRTIPTTGSIREVAAESDAEAAPVLSLREQHTESKMHRLLSRVRQTVAALVPRPAPVLDITSEIEKRATPSYSLPPRHQDDPAEEEGIAANWAASAGL